MKAPERRAASSRSVAGCREARTRQSRIAIPLALFLLAVIAAERVAAEGIAAEGETGGAAWTFRHQGLGISLALVPLAEGRNALRAGEPIAARLEVTDALTSTALSGLNPAAWLYRLKPGETPAKDSCQAEAETLLGGSLLFPPDVELNTYSVVTLNEGPTISVLEPRFGLGDSRFEALVPLPAPGEDWALSADQAHLFVTLPDADQVAVLDTDRWRRVRTLGTGALPRRAALTPDGRYLFVGCDGSRPGWSSGVSVLDARQLSFLTHIPTGRGAHDIAFSSDGRLVFVTNREADTVSILDLWKLEKIRDLHLGKAPVSVAFSELAQAAFVSHAGDGVLAAIGGPSPRRRAKVEIGPGLGELRFAPGGRWGFTVDPARHQIHVLDAASHRIVHTAAVARGPERVHFSDELAYITHRHSEIVLMVPLGAVGQEARLPLIDFPGGQHPFGRGGPPARAESIVQVPGANAVLVANPLDEAIYYYKEGMAAPMGNLASDGHRPRAVLAFDRSLREVSPGTYRTRFQIARPGVYRLVLYLDNPRLARCFELSVEADRELLEEKSHPASPTVEVRSRAQPAAPVVGQTVTVRFELPEAESGGSSEPGAVKAIVFLAPGRRPRELETERIEAGVYAARFNPAEPGVYYFFLACATCGPPGVGEPHLSLTVLSGAAAPPQPRRH